MTDRRASATASFSGTNLYFFDAEGSPAALDGTAPVEQLPYLVHSDPETGVEFAIASWPAVIGAAASVLSFVFDRMEADDGDRHWPQVLESLGRIEATLQQLLGGLRQLEIHISTVVSEQRELQDVGVLIAAIKSYYRSYPGFGDVDWRRRRTDLLLNTLDSAAWMVEQNGLQFVVVMGNAMSAHHDLFHFNDTPNSARIAAFSAYRDYFEFAASSRPGSLGAAIASYDAALEANARAIESKRAELPLGNRHISTWSGFSYSSGRNHCTCDVLCYAVVQAVPGHAYRRRAPKSLWTAVARGVSCYRRGHGRDPVLDSKDACACTDAEELDEAALVGDWIAASDGNCHGPMGRQCSQLFGGYFEPFARTVARWNADMDRLHQQRAELRTKREIATGLRAQAKRALGLATRWVADPTLDPPADPIGALAPTSSARAR